ncbi:short chain dehydrogenase, partial [Streptomyces sp. NPDC059744]
GGAKFDSSTEPFSFDELAELLSPSYEDRPANETFAAAEVLGLKRD